MKKVGDSAETRTALYRKYRPSSLGEVVGQSQVTDILLRSLKQGKVAHAYLLTGPKGTGKTSIARILAHEINGLPYTAEDNHLDIIEIDAASNNGVDDVRELRDKVQLAPIAAKKKIYIIDEVHMLSKPAFNALLKTLEEPPSHIVFILATTDLHKIPATIISRTQHFAFHAISRDNIVAQLRKIADSENIKVSDDALAAIAERGDGSFRNSISLLDQMSSFADTKEGITLELVQSSLGLASTEAVTQLLGAVADRDVAGVINTLDALADGGIQPTVLADQLIGAVRARLAEQPQSVTLLEGLLTVQQSPQPHLKLLTVLVGAIKPKTSVAAAVTVPRHSAVILEAPVKIVHKSQVAKAQPKPIEMPAVAEDVIEKAPAKSKNRKSGTQVDLNWAKLIEYTRQNQIALHSVLSKCTHSLDDNTLTLYTGRKFNKTKLDQAKYTQLLQEALEHVGAAGLSIVTLPTTQPPTDERLASIAAMMGGGQEVVLDEAIGEPS